MVGFVLRRVLIREKNFNDIIFVNRQGGGKFFYDPTAKQSHKAVIQYVQYPRTVERRCRLARGVNTDNCQQYAAPGIDLFS